MSETTQRETLFKKAAALEEGDDIEILGERLKVVSVMHSAAQKKAILYGWHEDTDQRPRYEIVADAKHDTVEIWPTHRTDTHSE